MSAPRDAAWSARMLAHSIKSLRLQRGYTQSDLAALCGWDQSMIARMENPAYRGWSCKSLLRLAIALRARVRVRFIPKCRNGEAQK